MSRIQVLPELVANKIAAGEVIERPSSIVKELVENSLDAGATGIDIEIKHGGRSLIRIADDGCGMSAEEAELAFLRHATSKISEADDMFAVRSFGFRGEALTSIAAVSRTLLMTRTAEAQTGTEILMEGGVLKVAREASCRPGTIIEVRDLFFNTPARRKFLRTDATEMGHILDAVSFLAFSRPDVRFSLKSGDRTVLDLPPCAKLEDRAEVILGDGARGHLMTLDIEANGMRVHGVIGKPFLARSNRGGQVFFVNGRWVKAYSLGYAVEAGYHGLTMQAQYPCALLMIEADLSKVDINVHPTKQEVRLSNEREVKSLIKKGIAEKLMEEGDLSPSLEAGAFAGSSGTAAYTARATEPRMPDFLTRPPVSDYEAGAEEETSSSRAADSEEPAFEPAGPGRDFGDEILLRNKLKITKVMGQIHGTFIVAETEEGLLVIDQHAAHERVMFEAVLGAMKAEKPSRQHLLMEEVLELHPRQTEILQESLPLLGRIGFEIEPFGDNTFVIRSFPAFLGGDSIVHFLRAYVEEKEAGKIKTNLENQQEDIAAMIACKRRSVKAHDAMTPQAMWSLLEKLAETENPFTCPHGRPTFFKQSFSDLEKFFKRK